MISDRELYMDSVIMYDGGRYMKSLYEIFG